MELHKELDSMIQLRTFYDSGVWSTPRCREGARSGDRLQEGWSQVSRMLVSPGEAGEAADTRWHHLAGEHRHPEPLQRPGVRDQQEPPEGGDLRGDRLHHHEESR